MLNDRASMGAFHLVPLPGGDPLTGPPAYTSCRKLQRCDFCELSLRLSWAFWLIQSLLSHLWSPTHTPVNNFWNSLAYYIGFERIVILPYFWFSICSGHMLAHIFSEKCSQWNLIRCHLLRRAFCHSPYTMKIHPSCCGYQLFLPFCLSCICSSIFIRMWQRRLLSPLGSFFYPKQRNMCSGLDLEIGAMGKQKDCCRWWLCGSLVKWVLSNLCQRDTSVSQSYEATICSRWSRMASRVSDVLCDVGGGRKLSS